MSHVRYPLIFNPKARSQKGKRALRFIMENATDFAMFATRSAEEAEELARKFAEDGEPVVIAAGGDGTLNAIVRGLGGSKTALGVLPTGTMNVFARELGIPFGSLEKSLDIIRAGHIQEVDLYRMNGQPFVQMAGVGFDAQVIQETSWESKKSFGPLAYLFSAVKVLGETPPKMTVTTDDGKVYEGVCVLAGNGSLYGGQFRLFSKACNHDEQLDILVFREAGYRAVLDSIKGVAMGDTDRWSNKVQYIQARSCTVECERVVPVEVDGDLAGEAQRVCFEPDAIKLRVLAPSEPVESRFTQVVRSLVQIPRRLGN